MPGPREAGFGGEHDHGDEPQEPDGAHRPRVPLHADRPASDAITNTPVSGVPGAIDPAPPSGPSAAAAPAHVERTGRAAVTIAIGILASRVLGFVRQGMISNYLGTSIAADAFNASMRIPNILQNLFGEGVLSASFIPVYAGLLARGEREVADRVAALVGALLALLMAVLVVIGMLTTPLLVSTVAAGFDDQARALTVRLVRVVFPAIGLLVMGAWCLGILNSHRRFLLSYLAPVASNVVLIGTLLYYGPRAVDARLATYLAWGAVAGSAAQLVVQLPTVLRVAPGLYQARRATAAVRGHVRVVARNFAPVLVGRGVVQISSYVDSTLASLVVPGAFTVVTNAQTLYTLPVSLFGMSIAAAELPAMSSLRGADAEVAASLRARLSSALRRVAFFVVPSAVAFLAFGDVLADAAFGYGRFTSADVRWVWGTLAGSAIGLLASTLGRLYSSTFYALRETRTPVRYALVRVALTLVLGYAAAVHAPRLLGVEARWGTAGLTAASGVAGWVEFALLRRAVKARIGRTGIPAAAVVRLWSAAAVAAAVGWTVKLVGVPGPALLLAGLVIGAYGVTYLGLTAALGEGESAALVARARRRVRRR